MPIYMDRHDVSETVTAEHVAQLHQEDLKIERQFGCRGLTYWFDEKRKTAFCLIEAPNKKAVSEMHNHAHGELPHSIIEVDEKIVESFLGRIEDPEKASNTELNIINDPAFRTIMYLELSNNIMDKIESNQFSLFSQRVHQSLSKAFKKFDGRVVKSDNESYLVSFKSVSNAIFCAEKIHQKLKYIIPKFEKLNKELKIGISSGIPVTESGNFFEEAVNLAKTICQNVSGLIIVTSEVAALYQSENRNTIMDKILIRTLKPMEEKFMVQLMHNVNNLWNNPNFSVPEFCKQFGCSNSQLYRKLGNLTGKSPVHFLRDFRLQKALELLHKQHGNISEIAYVTGFNSATYFSKCFMDKYKILPSKYMQQHIF